MAEMEKKIGVTKLISEISCVVDRAKLPNLVNVAAVGFIYFSTTGRKMLWWNSICMDPFSKLL